MRNILDNYSLDNQFWQYNPQFTAMNPFRKLYKSDKSRNKRVSSDLMWAITLIYHPESDWYNLPDKEAMAAKDILKNKELDWSVHEELVTAFKDMCLSQAEKSLLAWDTRMKDRDKFLEGQSYTFGEDYVDDDGVMHTTKSNVKELDEMAARTSKLYQEYFKIKADLEREDTIKKGTKISSLSDSGEI